MSEMWFQIGENPLHGLGLIVDVWHLAILMGECYGRYAVCHLYNITNPFTDLSGNQRIVHSI